MVVTVKGKSGVGYAAARVLARRLKGRHAYRRRRDAKIAVGWLGRQYNETNRYGTFLHQLVGYDPDRHTVTFRALGGNGMVGKWTTDRFWRELKRGTLVEV